VRAFDDSDSEFLVDVNLGDTGHQIRCGRAGRTGTIPP
jgi:hypothetical protein